ncbi:MAG: hypothetical protein APR54_02340 [Candidatus Cloacimonas sp. SDB]|nr:MAG: hypothetical protein APR54_02340 [Candidatus Cloacimonas sp. SDB]
MKLAVIGNKDFFGYKLFCKTISRHQNITTIISGGAPGTDAMAKRYAAENEIDFLEFPPQYDKFGPEAKHYRDRQIVDNCDMVLAFWDGNCEGTSYTIDYARKIKKKVIIKKIICQDVHI